MVHRVIETAARIRERAGLAEPPFSTRTIIRSASLECSL